jgi:GTPase
LRGLNRSEMKGTAARSGAQDPKDGSSRRGDEREGEGPLRVVVLAPVLRGRNGEAGVPAGMAPLSKAMGERLSPEERLREAVALAGALDGLEVCRHGLVATPEPRPATLFGQGKVEELKGWVEAEAADLVIVDHSLSPVQQRNLEKAWDVKVLDRTGLILEIFGARARTKEGRLQVELAHLTYQKSRLVRSWTHLERQRGGFGFLGGPGETQIEADRRVIGERIYAIRHELETVKRRRELHRKGRRRVPYPVVALVGYTNAGKSTLFNRLTGASVLAEDKLFATLDPTMRAVKLPAGGTVIVSDTVGFISDLPTSLIAAFRATLEEVVEADLILHVRDMAASGAEAQRTGVEDVLREIGVDVDACHGPDPGGRILQVWNKVDLLDAAAREELAHAAGRAEQRPAIVSAVGGEGVNALLTHIEAWFKREFVERCFEVEAEHGALAHWLYENADVLERVDREDGGVRLRVRIGCAKLAQFEHMRSARD